jgi:phosphoglycerate dehydrogenase-like enzyme
MIRGMQHRPRVAVLDDYLGVGPALAPWHELPVDRTFFQAPLGAEDDLVAALRPFEVICAMRERTAFPSSVLERLPNLRLLVTTGMQNSAIDVAAARAHGVIVSGTGGVPEATVELTWALILAAVRHVPEHDRAMRAGAWQTHLGGDLAGRRLGVLGLGKNGARVAAIGRAFAMDVVAWSANLTSDVARDAGAQLVAKEELLETSDVVTIHLRLGDRTRGLIGPAELASMKPGAVLVNTSRGPIVQESALIDALLAGRLRSAALDVYDEEPLPADSPLRRVPNLVLSPHTGYVSEANLRRFHEETVEDIRAWLAGQPIRLL